MKQRLKSVNAVLDDLKSGHPRKVLLAASTGGHLAQLVRIAEGWDLADESLWVTFDTPQSRSLLAGRRVLYVPYIRPRGALAAARCARVVGKILAAENFDLAVSTGAALALSALSTSSLRSIPSLYIESVSRVDGPSLSGRLLHASRLVEMRTQHPGWAVGRWRPHPSVLSQFEPVIIPSHATLKPRLFVTLGTISPYRFDAAIDAIMRTGLTSDQTVWQVGVTTRHDLPGQVHEQVSATEFERLARSADVVVSHSGVGTILSMLEWGVHPVVVPRRASRNEHVDNHQSQIAELLKRLGVAHVSEVDALTAEFLIDASRYRTRPRSRHAREDPT